MENNLKFNLLCQIFAMVAGVILVILGAIGLTKYLGLFVLMIFGGLLFGGGFGIFMAMLLDYKSEGTNNDTK